MQNCIFIGLLLKFGLVKNKREAYLMCENTLIIISCFFFFSWIFRNFTFRKFLLRCMGWFSLKLWEVLGNISVQNSNLTSKIQEIFNWQLKSRQLAIFGQFQFGQDKSENSLFNIIWKYKICCWVQNITPCGLSKVLPLGWVKNGTASNPTFC